MLGRGYPPVPPPSGPDEGDALDTLVEGVVVVHASQDGELADWRGRVVLHPKTGTYISRAKGLEVCVSWHAGRDGHGKRLSPKPAWIDVWAVEPVAADPQLDPALPAPDRGASREEDGGV